MFDGTREQGGDVSPVRAFLDDCRLKNLQPTTVDQKRRCLARLERAWGEPLGLTTVEIRAFLARLDQAESRATELAHLRTFYKWAVLNGYRSDDPTLPIPRPKVPRRLPRPIPEEDLRMAIDTAPERIRLMLLLAAYAGLRAKEIAELRGESIWWQYDPPVLVVEEQKGGDMGAVPLAPILVEELAGAARSGWVFPRRDGTPGPNKPWMVSRLCNDHLHSLGITHTLHTLRHRFGTQALRMSKGNLRITQELMRHRTPVSTALYTWINPAESAEVVRALPTYG